MNFEELKKYLPAALVTYVAIFSISFLFAVGFSKLIKNAKKQNVPQTLGEGFEYDTNASPLPAKTIYSVVLLGQGGDGHSGGSLTDSIIQVIVDTQNKKVVTVSIPRDLWVSIPTDYENETNHKINEAYAIALDETMYPNKKPEFRGEAGAGELVKEVTGKVTGVKPDYFAAVDFSRFAKIVDLLGGLEVQSKVAWDDYFYPVKGKENETCGKSPQEIASLSSKYSGFELEKQFECRYEHIHFDQGKNKMDGQLALKFVRSRHSESYGGDFARSEKQFALLEAVKNKLVSTNAIGNGGKILNELFNLVRTDLNTRQVADLLNTLGNIGDYKVSRIFLNDQNVFNNSKNSFGQYILVPKAGNNNFSQIKKMIEDELAS